MTMQVAGSGRIEDVYPLSPMQEGMLYHTLRDAGGSAYVGQFGFTVDGDLDAGAFQRAWQGAMDRHQALRASFRWEKVKRPLQAIHRRLACPFHLQDLRAFAAAERDAHIDAYLAADRARGFNPARPPLMRVALFRTGEREHRVVWTHHHMLLDGWSVGLVYADVLALYRPYRIGEKPRLAPVRQFRDYIAWLQGIDPSRAESFWQRSLAGVRSATPLAVGHEAIDSELGDGARQLKLGPVLTAALDAAARRQGLTTATLVHAAWALVLSRYSGESAVVFGSTVSGRPAAIEGVEAVVGLFINTIPVCIRVDGDITVAAFLRHCQETLAAAREHEYTPLVNVQGWSGVPHGQPLFESYVSVQTFPGFGAEEERGIRVRDAWGVEGAGFPLAIAAEPGPGGITLDVGFARARFSGAAMERLLGHMATALDAIARDPARRLDEVSILSPAERATMLSSCAGPTNSYPVGASVYTRITELAREWPDATAAVHGAERLTYVALQARAGVLARVLRRAGVGPEVAVALFLPRSNDLAVAILAVLEAGGFYVPVDPAYPAERIAFLVRDSAAPVVLTTAALAEALPPHAARAILVDALDACIDGATSDPGDRGNEADRAKSSEIASPDALAYAIYTSGSTGLPKAVMVSHRSLLCYAETMAAELGLGTTDRFLQCASPSFDVMVEEIFPAWLSGAAVVFPEFDVLASPDALTDEVARQGVTALEVPTAFWHEWVRGLASHGGSLPECVRFVIVGGERVIPARLREWAEMNVPLVHVFGLTETTVTSTTLRVAAGEDSSERWANLPIGRPLANVQTLVLDGRMDLVATGVPGELYLGGPGVARGYLGRPGLTAGRYVPHPFSAEAGERLYRTGDRVRWLEDGTLEFLGRTDHQIKIRGFRIEPAEIEAVLESHPAVREAAVVMREDTPEDRRLVAYVSPSAGYAVAPEGLRRLAGARVELWPSYGEYPVYDELRYRAMGANQKHNGGYLEALRAHAAGKIVVDVGTGGEIVLARLALEAGARHVYAIEEREESHHRAQERIRELGLEERVTLILGDATTTSLPEAVDVCVSQLIGCIGGSAGAVTILNQARRWLKPGGVMIPRRCVTCVAAVTLPEEVHAEPAFTELGAHYAEQVFAAVGHREDLRLCIRNFPSDHLLSDSAVFEDLDFSEWTDPAFRNRFELRVERGGRLDGLLLWIQLHPWERMTVDALVDECDRLPMFLPVFYPGVEVRAGDVLRVDVHGAPAEGAAYPDYHLRGVLVRGDGKEEAFAYGSYWKLPPEQTNALHRRLVATDGLQVRVAEKGQVGAAELRAYLALSLPPYMVPGAFVALETLPLTHNGKVDRRALPRPGGAPPSDPATHLRPRTATERDIAEIWCDVLGVTAVASGDSFFGLGGDSLLMIRMHSRLQERLGRRFPMMELFQHRTLADLAAHLDSGSVAVDDKPKLARRRPRIATDGAIAVVGIAGRFPGARNMGEFWSNLRGGVSGITEFGDEELIAAGVPAAHLEDPRFVRARGVVEDVDRFDAALFGFSPREAAILNPQHRIFLETVWEALESAGYDPLDCPGRVGVFTGADLNGYWFHGASQPELAEGAGAMQVELSNDSDFVPTRVSFALGLDGPSMNVQTACSSSLVAVHLACRSLLAGECEMALAGGVSIQVPQASGYLYEEGGTLSPDGRCRAYDAAARGTVPGSGVGAVVLKRVEDARADGDTVLAVILGSAVNNDGGGKAGYTAPRRDGQARVISEAFAVAGVSPDSIGYVEGHGTGTPVGDPVEVAALTQAFRAETDRSQFCALGSVKASIGHLDAAAGIAGLIKTVLALRHRELVPSLFYERPNREIEFAATPFYVNTVSCPWPRSGTPRRAGVSAFGLGGTNAHVVLEEGDEIEAEAAPSRPHQLLVLSARSEAALNAAAAGLAAHLRAQPSIVLADAAHTLQVGRHRFAHRRAVICTSVEDAAAALESTDPPATADAVEERTGRPVVFLFPGLGDHYDGMARGLYHTEPIFRAEVDRCAALLAPRLGFDLREVLFAGRASDEAALPAGEIDLRRMLSSRRTGGVESNSPLAHTELAHPAVFVVEYALARLWMSWGVYPSALVGHSLGEYVAACLAGVFSLPDALTLVSERARLVAALPGGAMLAVPLSESELAPRLDGELVIATVNAPSLCTVSGSEAAVARLERRLTAEEIPCRRLTASHAFHSPAMEPVARQLAQAFRGVELKAPSIPILSCITGEWMHASEATDPEYWVGHLCRIVRFGDAVARAASNPEHLLLEVGPGRTLGTFALQAGATPGSVFASMRHAYTRQPDGAFLLSTLGRLWAAGADVDWRAFSAHERRRRIPLPTYPFERERYWLDARPPTPADKGARRLGRWARGTKTLRPPRAVETMPTATRFARPAVTGADIDPIERRVEAIWAELLGLEEVGAHDDVFALGAHSLLAIRVLSRLREEFGIELTLRNVLENPTAAALAREVASWRAPIAPRVPPLVRAARREGGESPLSFGQERFWVLAQIDPTSPFYNVPAAQHLRGSVDPTALDRAVRELMRRHEILRTVYRQGVDGAPVQVVGSVPGQMLTVIDLTALPYGERMPVARRLAQAEAATPLDLASSVMRARLYRIADEENVLLLLLHHVVTDGWSWSIVWGELGALFAAALRGEPSPLPNLPLQYSDYAAWQREWLSGSAVESQAAFWRDQLRDAPARTELPTDRPRPPVQRHRGSLHSFPLSARLVSRLDALARVRGTSLYTVMLAGFQTLITRYTGQEDVVVGGLASNRVGTETEGLIGYFLNTLPLRTALAGNPTFGDVVGRVRSTVLDADEHQHLPFERILEAAQAPRDAASHPLFQLMFVLQRPVGRTAVLPTAPGVEMEFIELDNRTSKLDLTLLVDDSGERLFGMVEFDSDLFDRETVERLAGHWVTLLEGAVADPDMPAASLPLLTEEERSRLASWHGVPAISPQAETVLAMTEMQAARTPDGVAVMFEDETLTHAELHRRAGRLAQRLVAQGVRRGARVAVSLYRSLELPVSLLAVWKAGAAYVPVDPDYPAERVAYMLADSNPAVVLTHRRLAAGMSAHGAPVLAVDEPDAEDGSFDDAALPVVVGSDLAYVIYTSGSTGKPKGAMNAHSGVAAHLAWMSDRFRAGPWLRVLQNTPLSFDVSVWEMFWPLTCGGLVVLSRPGAHGDPAYLSEVVEREEITMLQFVPSLLRAFVEHGDPARCRSLRQVVSVGEALPPAVVGEFIRRFPDAQLHNLYGPTEAAVELAGWACTSADGEHASVPIGFAAPGTRLHVLDPHGVEVPVGVAGELHIAGAQVGVGYWGRPGVTAEKFIPDPYSPVPGARMYRTGDRARRLASGALDFMGRLDRQVKLRGFRIEPGEVEAVLAAHPRVRQAVVGVRTLNAGEPALVAWMVAGDEPVSDDELRAWLAAHLPEAMVPAALVMLPALPLAPNGKLDYSALPTPVLASHPAATRPLTAAETVLARIWAQVLGVVDVGARDNYFALGGDSILAIQVVSRARAEGLLLRPRQLFEHPTIEALAAAAVPAAVVAAEQEPAAGNAPLTPAQEWLFGHELANPNHWNRSALLEVRDPTPGPHTMAAAVNHVLTHHDALRLRFVEVDGRLVQLQAPVGGLLPFTQLDFSAATDADLPAALARASEHVQRSLNLQDGPLVRVAWIDAGPGRPVRLLVVVHHLVTDEVSSRILLGDLQTAYEQIGRGAVVSLPHKTSPFVAWARRLSEHARSQELRAEAGFWISEAQQSGPQLPVDLDGANTVGSARTLTVELSTDETRALLQEVAPAFRARVEEVLAAALVEALAPWTGERRLRVQLEAQGRDESFGELDLWRTVGWFTSLYPLVLDLGPDAAPSTGVKRVKEQLRAVPRSGIGHGLLRFGAAGTWARAILDPIPVPEVGFVYLDEAGHTFTSASAFDPAAEGAGADESPDNLRPCLLDVQTQVGGGRLRCTWTYGAYVHLRETIEALAERFLDVLRELASACAMGQAGGCTPSDFPLATVSQDELDARFDDGRKVESVFPLSPMQQAMLFATLCEPGNYLGQFVAHLEGAMDETRFGRALQAVVNRHPGLRTAFVWDRADEPLQVVRAQANVPFTCEDWRSLEPAERDARLQEFLKHDRVRGIDPGSAPLLRATLLRTGQSTWTLVWTLHHLVSDEWSLHLVVRDILDAYGTLSGGGEARLRPAPSFEKYVAWLRRHDTARDESFWRDEMRGFIRPTPLPVDDGAGTWPADAVPTLSAHLPREATGELVSLARTHGMALAALLQAAWGLLLVRYSGDSDVVFGTPVSGRTAEVDGVEEIVGNLLNSIPVRVRVASDVAVVPWLLDHHARHAARRGHDHTPLAEIARWSEVPPGRPLFESLLNLESVTPAAVRAPATTGLEIRRAEMRGRNGFPLSVVVRPDDRLEINATCDPARFSPEGLQRILNDFVALLAAIAAEPGARVADLALASGGEPASLTVAATALRAQGAATVPLFATTTQEILAAIWSEVLGGVLPGPHEDFFSLGGHSLLATRIAFRVQEEFGVDLPLNALLDAPTVASFAERVEAAMSARCQS